MTALSVPEVLRRAEAVIGERGWHRGDYEDSATGAVCMVGAVRVAVSGTTEVCGMRNEEYALAENVRSVLHDFLDEGPEVFNDARGRMAIEVRAALLRAADQAVTE